MIAHYRVLANVGLDMCDDDPMSMAVRTLCDDIESMLTAASSMRDAIYDLVAAWNAEDLGAFMTALNALEERTRKEAKQ